MTKRFFHTYRCTFLTLAVILVCTPVFEANAQQGTVQTEDKSLSASNWYISAIAGEQILFKGSTNGKYFVGKLNTGTWFDSWSGLKINLQLGTKRLYDNVSARYYSFGADYTFNLLRLFCPNSYDADTPFSFSLSAGPAMNFIRHEYKNMEYTPAVSLNIGAQIGYDFSPRWGIFAEVMSYTMDRITSRGFNPYTGFDCAIGLRFKISPHKYGNDSSDRQYYESRIKELTERVSELEMYMKKESDPIDTGHGGQVILAPETEAMSIDIYFDEFSSFINEEQRKKIDGIGEWMKDNPDFNVRIIVFSDNLSDPETGNRLMNNRADVLENLLMTKYGIDSGRIESINSEEAGYRNLTGCNAKIIFTR